MESGRRRGRDREKLVDKHASLPSNWWMMLYASQEVLAKADFTVHLMLVFLPPFNSPHSSLLLAGLDLK